jgi:hypothetical protein
MKSTKYVGMIIFFVVLTASFHILFHSSTGVSPTAHWVAAIAFGLISSLLLDAATQPKKVQH